MASSTSSALYEEYLRAPGWAFALLGVMLGLTSGGLTAIGIRSLTDDPILSGGQAAIFFIGFAIGSAIILYVMLNATLLNIRADEKRLEVKLGILGAGAAWSCETISSVSPASHNVMRHGGRGNIFAPSSRRSWTMIGIRTGIEFTVQDEDGNVKTHFISTRNGEEFARFVEGMSGSGSK